MIEATNDNRTFLYRIRRVEDGKFLVSAPLPTPGGCPYWGATGCFWKKPETIIKHLKELCAFRVYCSDKGFVYKRSPQGQEYRKLMGENPFHYSYQAQTPHFLVGYYPQWLSKYEVLATEISEHSTTSFTAEIFTELFEKAKEEMLAHAQ